MGQPEESVMEGVVDHFTAEGNYAMAINAAGTVLREYEEQAAGDPGAYQPLVDRIKAKIERLTAEARAVGADTELRPSAFTQALIAVANPHPTPEDEAVIAAAKAAAEAEGMSGYVNETLAGMAAAARAPDTRSDPRLAQSLARTAEFERTIQRDSRRRGVDGSVYEAAVTAAVLPMSPAGNLARRFARQAALLRRFGHEKDAMTAAGEAMRRYRDRDDLDDDEKGYFAYSMVEVVETRLARGDVPGARNVAAAAMDLMIEYRHRMIPTGIPDLVRNGVLLAECHARLGDTPAAQQVLVDMTTLADTLDASFGGPVGEPGTMPTGWGLPVVPSQKEWRALRKRLARLSRRLGSA